LTFVIRMGHCVLYCLSDSYLSRSYSKVRWTVSKVFSCGYASSPCADSVLSCGELLRAVGFFCRLGEKSLPICRDVRKSFT
jgi:hypothetical protein